MTKPVAASTTPATSTTADRIAYNEVLDALWELESWAHDASRNATEDVAEGRRLVDELVTKARRHREAHREASS